METEGFPVLVPDKYNFFFSQEFLFVGFPRHLKETDNHKKRGASNLRQAGPCLLITHQSIVSPMAY